MWCYYPISFSPLTIFIILLIAKIFVCKELKWRWVLAPLYIPFLLIVLLLCCAI